MVGISITHLREQLEGGGPPEKHISGLPTFTYDKPDDQLYIRVLSSLVDRSEIVAGTATLSSAGALAQIEVKVEAWPPAGQHF